jgi:hypothetical protein
VLACLEGLFIHESHKIQRFISIMPFLITY